MKLEFIKRAIDLANQSIDRDGGPFGALIVKDGNIIAEGSNCVTRENDPTAHAEMVAIRKAAKQLQDYQLDGCELYTSSEPCPMCLSAIYWAHIETVYYVNAHNQASDAGFDDSFIYSEIALPHQRKRITIEQVADGKVLSNGKEIFEKWLRKSDKTLY